jgi:phage shock protein A
MDITEEYGKQLVDKRQTVADIAGDMRELQEKLGQVEKAYLLAIELNRQKEEAEARVQELRTALSGAMSTLIRLHNDYNVVAEKYAAKLC